SSSARYFRDLPPIDSNSPPTNTLSLTTASACTLSSAPASQPVASPVATSREATPLHGAPPIEPKAPATHIWSPDRMRWLTSPFAPGFQPVSAPFASKAASRLRTLPEEDVNAPPT